MQIQPGAEYGITETDEVSRTRVSVFDSIRLLDVSRCRLFFVFLPNQITSIWRDVRNLIYNKINLLAEYTSVIFKK